MKLPNFAIGQIVSWIRSPPLTAVELPTDMLEDIMLHLPADEVCRLRLLCPTWRSLTFDAHFARAHASRHPQPHIIVLRHGDGDGEAAEVRDLDLHGNVIKSIRIRRPIAPLSLHGDLLCASHSWRMSSVVDVVTGAAADVGVDHRKKVNAATPFCVLGQVPATGEYKVLRIQADYCCRRRRQMCEVMTLGVVGGGGGGDAGRWRRRTCPPVTLWTLSSWNVVAVGGLVYFLDCRDWDIEQDPSLTADSIAVFDLATEEWKPLVLQGPLTSSILAGTDDTEDDDTDVELEEDDDDDPIMWWLIEMEPWLRVLCLRRNDFQLAKLGESLVVVYSNVKKSLTELWFMEDMVDATTARWSKRYTLRCTPFGDDRWSLQYHYPLAVLDDQRIIVWVERISALKVYDPKTYMWTDLDTLQTGDCVVGMHHGSLLCSNNAGAAGPDLSVFEEEACNGWHPNYAVIPRSLFVCLFVLFLVLVYLLNCLRA